MNPNTGERLIKKYPNRRLYDTAASAYVTLNDIKHLVLQNHSFKVFDAKTGDDLTRSVLLQIILEEESGGVPMFTGPMLEHIIRFYGHARQSMMGVYLEKSMQAFIDVQSELAGQSKGWYEGAPFTADMWAQFLNVQAPVMQGVMSDYIEQSKNLFMQMQEQMQNQTKDLLNRFPFGMPPAPPKSEDRQE